MPPCATTATSAAHFSPVAPTTSCPAPGAPTKALLALAKLPASSRTPLIDEAIRQGADFLLGTDPAGAQYPTRTGGKPSPNWWKFGFPVFYITDLLELAEALVELGYGRDPRLANALALIREKQDPQGRWPLEYDDAGKTYAGFGTKKTAQQVGHPACPARAEGGRLIPKQTRVRSGAGAPGADDLPKNLQEGPRRQGEVVLWRRARPAARVAFTRRIAA